MAIYTIHSRGPELDEISDAQFLRNGFSFGAFWLGPIWLLRHGLYAACLAWIGAFVTSAIAAATILSPGAGLAVLFAIQAFLGLEADALLERKLARNGYGLVDIVAAKNLDEAEVTFFRRRGITSPPPESEARA